MKVLIVTPNYPPYVYGGGGVVARAIAHGLTKRGHEITVISGFYPKKTSNKKPCKGHDQEVDVIWIPLAKIAGRYPQLRYSLPPNVYSSAFLKNMVNYRKYDVIHLCAFGHLLIDYVNFVAKNPRKILTVHAFPKFVEKKGKAPFVLKLLYQTYLWTLGKYTLNSAKAITAISKFVAEECFRKGIPKDKVKVIENGIDLERYTPVNYDKFEEKFHLRKEDVVILSISRVVWYKGFEYAIEAIHKVAKTINKPIKYVIVGPHEEENYYLKLKKQVERLGLEDYIKFTGILSDDMKLQALSRADIFLAPSLHEGFGLVILEAMALGKPIIASNCEGFQCILKNMETGILTKPANSEEISKAILLLLNDSALREKLSRNALSVIKKYDWRERVDAYEQLYEQISRK